VRAELCDGDAALSDDQVIGAAVDRSSYFAGLWTLIEVQICSVSRAMAHWTRGNIEPYFRLFPLLTLLIAASEKPKVARAMIYKLERLLYYNEKHPDVLRFFAENCLTLRETAIEDWHSILTHYVNRHVVNVSNAHYEKATCSAAQLRKVRKDLDEVLQQRKPALPERLGLLQKMEGKAFDETNTSLAEFLFKPFEEMVAQLKAGVGCTGEYADELWPRERSEGLLARGAAGVEVALKLTEDFHAKFVAALTAPAEPEGLLEWLNHSKQVMTKVHGPELVRRGLTLSGNKGEKSERIYQHVLAHRGGYTSAKDEKDYGAPPWGYGGAAPAPAAAAAADPVPAATAAPAAVAPPPAAAAAMDEV